MFSSNQEKLVAERRIPVLQSQLEEYKSILCQLQAQKYKLQTEVLPLLDINATMTLWFLWAHIKNWKVKEERTEGTGDGAAERGYSEQKPVM